MKKDDKIKFNFEVDDSEVTKEFDKLTAERDQLSAETESLKAKITELTSQTTELTSDLQRTRADFENYRKQVEAQKSSAIIASAEATVEKLLPLLDDLDRAFAAYAELAPLQKSLEKTLTTLKISKIDSTPDTEFNPDLHDAIAVEGDGDAELITETLRPGYYYDSAVLRPAMVKVEKK